MTSEQSQTKGGRPQNMEVEYKYPPMVFAKYIAAGTSIVVAVWLSIGGKFAQFLHENELFGDLREERSKAYQEFFKSGEGDLISKQKEIEKEYAKKFDERLVEKGINNTFDKFRALKTPQKIQTALSIVGVAAVAAVALFSFAGKNRKKHAAVTVIQPEAEPTSTPSRPVVEARTHVSPGTRRISEDVAPQTHLADGEKEAALMQPDAREHSLS